METLDMQEQILDKLNALIVVLNNDGSADYVSKPAQHLLGYRSDELLGNNWWEATRFSRPEGIEIKKKILGLFTDKRSSVHTFEHKLKTSYGGQKWVRWDVSYLNDDQLIGIGYDITEKKNSERKLLEQNEKLSEQNNDIRGSITYAKRIQESILQKQDTIKKIFPEHFLIYAPKDIVSGDYFWFFETEQYKYAAVVDCTGHGVPGAMMCMVANSVFKEVFLNKKISEPSLILHALDEELEKSFSKSMDDPFNDGMDVGLIQINKATNELHFSGALRSMIIANKSSVTEFKGSRYPIGFYSGVTKHFDTIKYYLQPGDSIYLYSDGYVDQFGGQENKKFNKVNFKELIRTAYEMPMPEQAAFLEYSFHNWKQDGEQTDDVCVVGIKIE